MHSRNPQSMCWVLGRCWGCKEFKQAGLTLSRKLRRIARAKFSQICLDIFWTIFGHFFGHFDKNAEKCRKIVEKVSKNCRKNVERMSIYCILFLKDRVGFLGSLEMSKKMSKKSKKLSKKCRKIVENAEKLSRMPFLKTPRFWDVLDIF